MQLRIARSFGLLGPRTALFSRQLPTRTLTRTYKSTASSALCRALDATATDSTWGPSWKVEPWDKGIKWGVKYSSVLHDTRSAYQHIQVLDTPSLGRVLVLDDALQTSERDESGYHEMITHVPLCRQGRRKTGDNRVLIIGGGDGGAAREALRHNDVSQVDLVDIDQEVMRVARSHLPSIWRHPSSSVDNPQPLEIDPRFKVHARDGVQFLREQTEGYDVIIVDASDPIGPGAALYSTEFYALLRDRLRPHGAVSVQSGSFWYMPHVLSTVFHGLKHVFPCVRTYQCFTAIYPGGLWNLQCATLGDDPTEVDETKVHELSVRHPFQWYSSDAHRSSFVLPPIAKQVLSTPPPALGDVTHELEQVMATVAEPSKDHTHVLSSHAWSFEAATALSQIIIQRHKHFNPTPPLAVFDADGTIWQTDITYDFWLYALREKLLDDAAERDLHHLRTVLEQWEGTTSPPASAADVAALEHRLMPGCELVGTHFYSYLRALGDKAPEVVSKFFDSLNPQDYQRRAIKQLMGYLKSHGWKIAVASASPRTLVEGGLRRTELSELIDVVVAGEDAPKQIYPAFSGKVTLLSRIFQQAPSIVVGDSFGDFPLFDWCEGVSIVLLNKHNQAMQALARSNGWITESTAEWE